MADSSRCASSSQFDGSELNDKRQPTTSFRSLVPAAFFSGVESFNSFGESIMLRWSLAFLVLALIAGVLGFTGIAGESMYIARILFYICVVIFLVGLVCSLVTGKRPAGL